MSVSGRMDRADWYIDTMEYFSALKSAVCDNIDEPWGNYAKWNKPVKER